MAVAFRASMAQCSAVLPCVLSTSLVEAPSVSSSRVGSSVLIFQQHHISGVMPPLSSKSGLTPLAIKYATSAVCPNWAARWMHEQPSASLDGIF